VELKTPRASVRLEASANRSQPGVFSNTDDDLAEYTALYSGTHRFEVVFADRLHVSGTNWRSDRRSNNTGDYYVESKAEVSFCP